MARRRDPEIDQLVMEAAPAVYTEFGWHGFTYEAIARRAGVGKPALYRRWSSREELLIRTFDTAIYPTARDCDSLTADVRDYAHQWIAYFNDPYLAKANNQLRADRAHHPKIAELYDQLVARPRLEASRQITRRAIARGELPEGFRTTIIGELLVGALHMHWNYTNEEQLPKMRRTLPQHASLLADITVRGILAYVEGNANDSRGTDLANHDS